MVGCSASHPCLDKTESLQKNRISTKESQNLKPRLSPSLGEFSCPHSPPAPILYSAVSLRISRLPSTIAGEAMIFPSITFSAAT